MTQPIIGGYASDIPDPDIENAGTLEQWQAMYVAILDHLLQLCKEGKAQQAYKDIPLVMDMSQNYITNGQNVEVSNRSNFNSTIGQYVNAIQEDFDQYSKATDPLDTSYAEDAADAKKQIDRLMSKYPTYAKGVNDLSNQLSAIFNFPSTAGSLAKWWKSLWDLPQPSDKPSKDGYQGTSVVSNAINAARNDVESQNTILNSQLQTYSKEAAKDLAFEQSCFRAVMDMIKTPVNAAKNASS